MQSYSKFAEVYDILMRDADYDARAEYLYGIFRDCGREPKLLLDVACGTGAFSNRFAKMGVEVIGIDRSEEMLSQARENSAEQCTDVLFLKQSAEELDLYGTVDGVICCLDSLNHITEKKKLAAALGRISLFLEKGGLFIFDVNTLYKHEQILGNNSFVIEEDGVYCVWQNQYTAKKRMTDITLDFFVKTGDLYKRSREEFSERAYLTGELEEMLGKAGLEVLNIYDDMTREPLRQDSQRAVFVCEKKQ